MKIDIEQYFASMDHSILTQLIRKKVKDKGMLFLIQKIINRSGARGKGLPIGNLTSQFFANVYLDVFDHFANIRYGQNPGARVKTAVPIA